MLNKIANLHKLCFPIKPWTADDFAELKKSGCEIISSENGFIVWRTVADETEIITIGVHPDSRGTGIADALLAIVEKELKSANLSHSTLAGDGGGDNFGRFKIFLEVAEDNIAAQKLYQRNGYKQIAIREKYYDDKINAIIMAKEL